MLKIELKEIPIRDIVKSYLDSGNDGVVGYDGKLNIRPAYQREFVYKEKERNAVMDTILKGFPLNIMYWCKNDDGTFEILDGQQRTISFCQFCSNEYMIIHNGALRTFMSMPKEDQDKILDYKCMIYICQGTQTEKLDWFRVINTAGVKLTDQELRNACYPGKWLTDAKIKFSKPSCPASQIASRYLTGAANRQEYLETALDWIRQDQKLDSIEEYMLKHQQDSSAIELWNYFTNVINWIDNLFPKYRAPMKGVPWGPLYNNYHDKDYDPKELEERVSKLFADDEVGSGQNKKGVFEYLFDGNEKHLNLRTFSDADKDTMYERQKGICPMCGGYFERDQMHGDHKIPWSKGGKTTLENGQMLCRDCNLKKGNI